MLSTNSEERFHFSASWLGGVCVTLIALAFLLLLNRLALFSSEYAELTIPLETSPMMYLESPWMNCFWTVVAAAFLYIAMALWLRQNSEQRLKLLLRCGALWMFTAGMLWIYQHRGYPICDQQIVHTVSQLTALQDYSGLQLPYFWAYPHQYSTVLLFSGLMRLTGSTDYQVIQFLNVICAAAAVWFGGMLVYRLTKQQLITAMYLVLMSFCLPLLFFTPFVYGDIICIGAVLAAMYFAVSFYDTGHWKFIAGLIVSASFAMMARKNSMIGLLAMVLVLLAVAVDRHSKVRFALSSAAVLLVIMVLVPWGSIKIAEHLMDQEAGSGSPAGAHCVMGLTDSEDRLTPGWYTGFGLEVCEQNHYDPEKIKAETNAVLHQRIAALTEDPAVAKDFFTRKVQGQWTDPSFQCLVMNNHSKGDRVGIAAWIYETPEGYGMIMGLMNRYQSLIYLASALGVAATLWYAVRFRKNVVFWCLPLVYFIGGFLFHLVWEAMPRYCLPYFIMLLPYAAYGIWQAAQWILAAGRKLCKTATK